MLITIFQCSILLLLAACLEFKKNTFVHCLWFVSWWQPFHWWMEWRGATAHFEKLNKWRDNLTQYNSQQNISKYGTNYSVGKFERHWPTAMKPLQMSRILINQLELRFIRGTQLENADADTEAKILNCDICISQSNCSNFRLWVPWNHVFQIQMQIRWALLWTSSSKVSSAPPSSNTTPSIFGCFWSPTRCPAQVEQHLVDCDVLIVGILNGILFIACFTNYFKSEVLMEKLTKSLDSLCSLGLV